MVLVPSFASFAKNPQIEMRLHLSVQWPQCTSMAETPSSSSSAFSSDVLLSLFDKIQVRSSQPTAPSSYNASITTLSTLQKYPTALRAVGLDNDEDMSGPTPRHAELTCAG